MPVTASYTSPLAESLAADVLERFQRYVRIDTQSALDQSTTPSTQKQFDLAKLLLAELQELGLEGVELDEQCYVTATLPGNVAGAPAIGVLAHLDVSYDAPSTGVEPIVHRNYDGGVIELPRGGTVLDPAAMPDLSHKVGHDLVSASGDTLLGADDKAGVSAIMTAVKHLLANPGAPRCTLKIAFTPALFTSTSIFPNWASTASRSADEEIGSLAAGLDLEKFAARCAYTIDGSEIGELSYESFSAKHAIVTIEGVDVHPGYAAGKMVSALRLAAEVLAALPSDRLTPATSSELLKETVAQVVDADPRASATVEVKRDYHNMKVEIEKDPEVIAAAEAAYRAEGIEPVSHPIRGGTDGSALSLRGLPTPNIFDGGYDYHSVREWASVQEMAAAAAVIVRLAEVWSSR